VIISVTVILFCAQRKKKVHLKKIQRRLPTSYRSWSRSELKSLPFIFNFLTVLSRRNFQEIVIQLKLEKYWFELEVVSEFKKRVFFLFST
jgi:hypothetical protein